MPLLEKVRSLLAAHWKAANNDLMLYKMWMSGGELQ